MKVLSSFAVRFRSARSTDARAVAVIRRCPTLIDTWLEAAFDQAGNSRLRPITKRPPPAGERISLGLVRTSTHRTFAGRAGHAGSGAWSLTLGLRAERGEIGRLRLVPGRGI